ncbi:MAG: hypothetical protein ACRDJW_07260 [Thermomicrobiales bacterium]
METAATVATAEHFGVRRVSILSVRDNPRTSRSLIASTRVP